MVCRLSRLLRPRGDGFVLILALAAVAVLVAPAASASAASPLTGETLGGATLTTNGGGAAWPSCVRREMADATATFNASGEAPDHIPARLRRIKVLRTCSTPSSITSSRTTTSRSRSRSHRAPPRTPPRSPDNQPLPILAVPRLYARLRAPLQWGRRRGPRRNTTGTYTATMQAPGQASQAISGQAQVFGSLSTKPGVPTSLTASFTG